MMDKNLIQSKVKSFILKEFLEGEDPEALTASTPLITAGILDSLATLKLVSFLEKEFAIQVQAHEADVDHLNTLDDITSLVSSKLA
ncbi:acyl carrier protein [Myxococcota bacterium]|nr:acyl carrier protein [Myxococcota bacterium]